MRSAALIFALLILLCGVSPVAALNPPGGDVTETRSATALDPAEGLPPLAALSNSAQVAQLDQPETVIQIELQANTDARWTVIHRYVLADENETAAFLEFGNAYENGRADVGLDAQLFRTVAQQASESTGRQMQIRNVSRAARVENGTGVLELSFTWTSFLERTDDGSLRLSDVFTTPGGGTWFSSLDRNQQLVIVTPPGYVVNSTSIQLRQQNNSVVVDGPREFSPEEPLVVTYRGSSQAEIPWMLLVGGGVVIVLAVVGAFVYLRRDGPTRGDRPTGSSGTTLTNGGESTASSKSNPTKPTATGERRDDTGAITGGESTAPSATDDAEHDADEADDEPDFELLSDEERVEYLLEQRGGRMKQANIVKETGWSDAKVSQLLSTMAEAGRVEKLRLGRENLISLPGEDDEDDENEA